MAKELKTIGVLTSGGDAPGMNAAIRAVVRTAIARGLKVKGIKKGYMGLLNEEIVDMESKSVSEIIQRGGTILGTARCLEFKTKEGQQKGAEICRKHGIDGIIVIGGDGSYRGAQALSNHIIDNRKHGKTHHIIINAEGIGHSTSMARRIEAATGIETRATILGYMQRGGSPTCKDRFYASIMGAYAVDILKEGKTNRVVGIQHGGSEDFDIEDALNMEKGIDNYEWEVAHLL